MIASAPTAIADVERLSVDLGDRSYDVVVGDGLVAEAGRLIEPLLAEARVIVVTDEVVARLHLPQLSLSLQNAGIACRSIVLPAGEQTKDFAHLQMLCERILAEGIERRTVLVALGGGVIGDIVGFAAGVLLRGIDFVQMPTTLLAQVDSSVGGKTGINTPQGKNLVGVFHQPRIVIADVGTLATLDDRQLRAGYAEVLKYGLLGDTGFFEWLEDNSGRVLGRETAALRHAVMVSCRAKAAIVAEDEREAGARALLNLGHTFGHALEVETGFGNALLHGESVAVGMVLAFELSARMGLIAAGDTARVRRHLQQVGLPTGMDVLRGRETTPERLIEHMRKDKKVRDGRLTFVLVRGIGRAFVCRDVDVEVLRRLLEDAFAVARASRSS